MTFKQALIYYGTSRNIARAIGVSKGRVSQMKASGGFSYPIQCVLEKDSEGTLLADRNDEPNQECSAA